MCHNNVSKSKGRGKVNAKRKTLYRIILVVIINTLTIIMFSEEKQ